MITERPSSWKYTDNIELDKNLSVLQESVFPTFFFNVIQKICHIDRDPYRIHYFGLKLRIDCNLISNFLFLPLVNGNRYDIW